MESTGSVHWRPVYFEVWHADQLLPIISNKIEQSETLASFIRYT